jgi:hypothetical protein
MEKSNRNSASYFSSSCIGYLPRKDLIAFKSACMLFSAVIRDIIDDFTVSSLVLMIG